MQRIFGCFLAQQFSKRCLATSTSSFHLCSVKNHRGHKCDAITDALPRHQQEIVEGLQHKLAAMNTAVEVSNREKTNGG